MSDIVDKIKRIKYLRMDNNERHLSYYFNKYEIVPYEHNKNRVFYKVNGKVCFEYHKDNDCVYFESKIFRKVKPTEVTKWKFGKKSNERDIVKQLLKKYLNIEVKKISTRDYVSYKLWRELSDVV